MTTIAPHPADPAQLRRIDEIFAARGASLVRAALALTGSRPDAEDLLQEAFVRALARPEVFDGRSDAEASGWLWIVMRRLWRDRQRGGLGRTSPMPADVEQRLVDDAPPIPDQVLHEWQLAVVYEGLARLGPRHRTAMVLLGRGLGEVEAAEAAGVSRRTMREWRRDARRALGVFGDRLGAGTICDGFEGSLSAYADGELGPGKQRTQLEAHLGHCGHCRAALEHVRTHTRTLGAVLPAVAAATWEDSHQIHDAPAHIGGAIQVIGEPRVVIGGHDGLLTYVEAHWRLAATAAIVALSGWAILGHALGHSGSPGTAIAHTKAPPVIGRDIREPRVRHTARAARSPARPTHRTLLIARRSGTGATARVRVASTAPVPPIASSTVHTSSAAPSSSGCHSASCLFGP
jgi:RNA polymerase sigma factor (sigma-70 family)